MPASQTPSHSGLPSGRYPSGQPSAGASFCSLETAPQAHRAPPASRKEAMYRPMQVLQKLPSLMAEMRAITMVAITGPRLVTPKNMYERLEAFSPPTTRAIAKAVKKAYRPRAAREMGMPPHQLSRNTAEYALYIAARQELSASVATGIPGMKLQCTACSWRSRWFT